MAIIGMGRVGIRSIAAPTSYTTRTTAFAAATGITDTTILNALNTFDTGLISNGLDSKMKALYPFVGGTATTHKFNFMDARDLDVAFRLQFFGGGTFSSTGYQPNGTNAYADTFLNASTQLTNNNYHLSHFSRTQKTNENGCDIGVSSSGNDLGLYQYYNTLGKIYVCGSYPTQSITASDTNTLGMLIGSRTSQTSAKMFMNNIQKGTTLTTINGFSLPNGNFFISANDGGSFPNNYSSKECAFSSIGDALTDGEATTFYNLVQAMQTTLSRQV